MHMCLRIREFGDKMIFALIIASPFYIPGIYYILDNGSFERTSRLLRDRVSESEKFTFNHGAISTLQGVWLLIQAFFAGSLSITFQNQLFWMGVLVMVLWIASFFIFARWVEVYVIRGKYFRQKE